ALPEPFRATAEAASTAVVHDVDGWSGTRAERPTPVHLDTVQSAVINGRQIILGYVAREGSPSTRVVHPLGLATKAGSWYLVGQTEAGLRTFRVDRIQSVEVTDDAVVRPPGFELVDAWKMITTEVEHVRLPVVVRALVDQRAMSSMRYTFGTRIRIGGAAVDGRVEVEIRSHSEYSVASELAGLGRQCEVLEPDTVRAQLADIASELSALYAGTAASANSAMEVKRHVGATSSAGVAVAPVPPLA
ncbi:MAG TPA: WYL domain-containing protein, partial [Ilumatobacteraceae bacterium]